MERAIGTLMTEGVLSASDRRGTFVCGYPTNRRVAPMTTPKLPAPKETLHATVGIIAGVAPYEPIEARNGQWSAQILAACEHGLSAERD